MQQVTLPRNFAAENCNILSRIKTGQVYAFLPQEKLEIRFFIFSFVPFTQFPGLITHFLKIYYS